MHISWSLNISIKGINKELLQEESLHIDLTVIAPYLTKLPGVLTALAKQGRAGRQILLKLQRLPVKGISVREKSDWVVAAN